MFTTTQELSALGQSQFDKAVRLSSIVLAGAERFASLQLDLSRKLLNDNAETFKALSEVKDAKTLGELQSNLAQRRWTRLFPQPAMSTTPRWSPRTS